MTILSCYFANNQLMVIIYKKKIDEFRHCSMYYSENSLDDDNKVI